MSFIIFWNCIKLVCKALIFISNKLSIFFVQCYFIFRRQNIRQISFLKRKTVLLNISKEIQIQKDRYLLDYKIGASILYFLRGDMNVSNYLRSNYV